MERPRGLIAAWVCACCAQRRRPAVALTKPPALPLPKESLGVSTLVFVRAAQPREYVLRQAGRSATPRLGPLKEDALLGAAPNRRSAARLRRLLELVLSKGEPLFASFSMGPPREGPAVADLVVAPLADADGRVCGALVAREVRQARRIGAPSPHWRGEIGRPCSIRSEARMLWR